MCPRVGDQFFDVKRDWSRQKDAILRRYLTPYLTKIKELRKPILVIDAFAGPGRFTLDHEPGSPLIICEYVAPLARQGYSVRVICIERSQALFTQLVQNLSLYTFAEARSGRFEDHVPDIAKLAENHSVFLYVDPCAIQGLDWNGLVKIFDALKTNNSSIEILMNFNASGFVRAGLASLKQQGPNTAEVARETLDHAVGGAWWQTILTDERDFDAQIDKITNGVCDALRTHFREIGRVRIWESQDKFKYYMIFGTRRSDGLELMNDAMYEAQNLDGVTMDLFATVDLPSRVLEATIKPKTRGDTILDVIRQEFGRFKRSEIRGCIENLLKSGRLSSRTGKVRINDKVEIWRNDSDVDIGGS